MADADAKPRGRRQVLKQHEQGGVMIGRLRTVVIAAAALCFTGVRGRRIVDHVGG
jgi:hypothetical protein